MGALTKQDGELSGQLSELEHVIETGIETFFSVGSALRAIRDGRLYYQTHSTFEDYLRARWQMDRTYAHRHIDAVDVRENLLPIGNILPTHESQIRPLKKLSPDAQREVWRRVATRGERITAKLIEEEVIYRGWRMVAADFQEFRHNVTLLLHTMGKTVEEIAEILEQPLESIRLMLEPKPPVRFDNPENGSDLFGEHQALVEQYYHDAIEQMASRQLELAYMAGGGIAQIAGITVASLHALLEAGMEEHETRQKRLHESLNDRFFEINEICDWSTLHVCIHNDYLASVGMQHEDKPFRELYSEWTERFLAATA